MRIAVSALLCDSIELAVLSVGKRLALEEIDSLLTAGTSKKDLGNYEPEDLIKEALGVAFKRATLCPEGYPFEVSERTIGLKINEKDRFCPYTFLLIGSFFRYGGASLKEQVKRDFRRYFEDLVCWSLRRSGFVAEVLSEPRVPRGLPQSLKPALKIIKERFGENAILLENKLTPADNDLGVDVLATFPPIDRGRSGRLVFLFQCATGPVGDLYSKMPEKEKIFPDVWQNGFYSSSIIRGGATPHDLLSMEEIYWDRLCQTGWVIDRMRIVHLCEILKTNPIDLPSGLEECSKELLSIVSELDWKNGWQESFD